jgi:hypothetical protein
MVGPLSSGWRLMLDAVPIRSPFTDDIAIDDINFVNCNPNDYLLSVKCDFEKDYCGFMNDSTGNFNWTRNKGKTSSDETGPPGDQYDLKINNLKLF